MHSKEAPPCISNTQTVPGFRNSDGAYFGVKDEMGSAHLSVMQE